MCLIRTLDEDKNLCGRRLFMNDNKEGFYDGAEYQEVEVDGQLSAVYTLKVPSTKWMTKTPT